jgi:hypothetical protein
MHAPPPVVPPPLLSQKPTRRTLLKVAGFGGLLLGGGTWVWRTVGRFGPPAPGLMVFDKSEFAILQKACEAFFPGPPEVPFSADEVQTAQFVDTYAGNLYPDTALLFRILVRTLNVSSLPTRGRSFYWLPLAGRQQLLQEWRVSDLKVRRAGYQSLSFAIKLGYYEDDRVRAAAGFESGCNLPQDTRPPGLGGKS